MIAWRTVTAAWFGTYKTNSRCREHNLPISQGRSLFPACFSTRVVYATPVAYPTHVDYLSYLETAITCCVVSPLIFLGQCVGTGPPQGFPFALREKGEGMRVSALP